MVQSAPVSGGDRIDAGFGPLLGAELSPGLGVMCLRSGAPTGGLNFQTGAGAARFWSGQRKFSATAEIRPPDYCEPSICRRSSVSGTSPSRSSPMTANEQSETSYAGSAPLARRRLNVLWATLRDKAVYRRDLLQQTAA